MANTTGSFKTRTWTYDFAQDTGTVAVHLSAGTFFPNNAVAAGGFAKVITNFAGGVLGTIQFGVVGNTAGFLGATLYGGLIAGGVFPLTSGFLIGGLQACSEILVNACTAGRIVLNVWYFEATE